MPPTPEQLARQDIDAALTAAGWHVQNRDEIDLAAGQGVAVREFSMGPGYGFADYLLYIDRQAAGAVEAKAGGTLTGVEAQSAKYGAGLPAKLPAHRRPLPFLFEANGTVVFFTNGLDPLPRSRRVYSFPRPESLAALLDRPKQVRAALQTLPPLEDTGLWPVQATTIARLERSLAEGRPRALVQMATGSGKTYTAVNACWRLLRHAGARRILFLVDRTNLGKQTEAEFRDFTAPGDGRKFDQLYTVQRLHSNSINAATNVAITTIQRVFSMLKGDEDYDPGNEERSGHETLSAWLGPPPEVAYNPALPPEFFDVIIVDECHRSIYELWSQVLLYFDAFLIGLTATPSKRTLVFFNENLVMEYGHEQAVADGVNVDFDVYRIRTRITDAGATIAVPEDTPVYVERRHRLTRAERLEQLDDDLTYTANQLDRDVVSESQIRTVVRTLRDRVYPEAFPRREEVPKTLIFAKDDSHADDIVRIVREEFAASNEFCEKITYRTGFTRVTKNVTDETGVERELTEWVRTATLSPEDLISNFRLSFHPRIAVTVDMISTGTDVKAIECVVFMRNVKSAGLFEQMKGRGVRVIDPEKLRGVTRSARRKDRFIVVDAVGVCERDKTDSQSLNRQPSASLETLLDYVGQGGTDPDALLTLAGRLARVSRDCTPAQLDELKALAGGRTLADLAKGLIDACDPDRAIEAARSEAGTRPPSPESIAAAAKALVHAATGPFLKPAFRRRIVEIRQTNEQTLDRHNLDQVTFAGFDAEARKKARATVDTFRAWIDTHRDELAALRVLWSGTRPLRIGLKDLRDLRDALARPPLSLTPARLWQAFEIAEAPEAQDRPVHESAGDTLADLARIVRHAIEPTTPLAPYAEAVRANYDRWLQARMKVGATFTREQLEWLARMRDHVATSLRIDLADFDAGWFGQQGAIGHAQQIFGDDLPRIVQDMNERVAE